MIYIVKNQINKVAVEVKQGVPQNNVHWLFEMINETGLSEKSIYFTTPDISPSPNRYNLFIIDERNTGSTSILVNDIPIKLDSGQWRVNMYGNSTPWNLSTVPTLGNPSQTIRMIVEGPNPPNLVVYEGKQQPQPVPNVYN
jgi:hypothetical protein